MLDGPLRVQFCLPTLEFGGMERQAVILANAVASRGHRVQLVCSRSAGGLRPLVGQGVELVSLNRPGRFLPGGVPGLNRAIAAFAPHVFNGFSNVGGFYGTILARVQRVPLVITNVQTVLDRYSPMTRVSAHLCLPWAHVVLVNSRSLMQHYGERWSHLAGRLALVPNMVDVEEFRPLGPGVRRAVRGELGLPQDAFVVAHVGRFVPEKAHEDMMHAAWHTPAAHWMFVGDGPLRPRIEALARELGLDRRVHFLGARADVSRLLQACDLFCLPSLWEGMPNALCEAMAVGLAAVGTRVPGIADLIEPGATGWLCPAGSPAAIAAAINDAAADDTRRNLYARQARDRAVAHHGGAAVSGLFLDLCVRHLH